MMSGCYTQRAEGSYVKRRKAMMCQVATPSERKALCEYRTEGPVVSLV